MTTNLIPTVELQKAVYQKLSAHYTTYDLRPPNAQFPYILIGEDVTVDNLTKGDKRTTHNLTIHTFSQSTKSLESKTMNHLVKESLLNDLELSGFYVDLNKLSMMMTTKEEETDGAIHHGIIQFDITIREK
ncbi:DUF3168 domain-containing protein [Planococcus sp. ANT_H30]|uniref:DUF3168 domain-containing protein n=1 Tax=Planococcus sp. ANT_H30 TaxID=2597347 RepID=UPI00165D5F0D|nr:DUF3168 domain-containing protein [Planococcus sp. ANT_H30]